MAVTCSSPSSYFPLKKSSPILKPASKVWMLKPRLVQVNTTTITVLQIRSSIRNKVFEDKSEGIICYTDDQGEMICEGYDEGPRFHQEIPKTANHPIREAEIIDLLFQQSWLQIVKGGEVKNGEKGVAVKEDMKVNGSNTFC